MLEAYFQEKRTAEGKNYKTSTVKGYTNIVTRHFETWLPLTLEQTAKLTPEVVIDRYRQAEANHGPFGARNAFVMLTAIINRWGTLGGLMPPAHTIRVSLAASFRVGPRRISAVF